MQRIKSGQKFGKWTTVKAVRIEESTGRKKTKWLVECECGNSAYVNSCDLNKGKTTQCRECRGSLPKDLNGKTFGSWLVTGIGEKKNGKTHWICRCKCGREENVCSASLTKGVSTRCLECFKKAMPVHGYTCQDNRHPLYIIWMGMLSRCNNPKNQSFKHYGGRGIKVCERWHDLKLFYEDMGDMPESRSIDRIDVNGDYTPENCRWANSNQQGRNKRNNRILEYNGEKKCLTEWAETLNIKVDTLNKFLTRNNFEKAIEHYTKQNKKSGL